MSHECIYPHETQVSFQGHAIGVVAILINESVSEVAQVGIMSRKVNVDLFPSRCQIKDS